MPEGSGTSLGAAQGRIVITVETAAAESQLNSFVQKTEQVAKQVATAFGIDLGIRGAKQLVDAAVAADQLATAYNRQMVAAQNLAGSQGQLNGLLDTYDKATGGILDKSEELSAVTKLMSVGFADSAQELDKFATAIRGISIAMGTSQDTVTQNLILELFSQRGQRLDQLGLQYDKVRQRADELRQADSSLTQQQAYQQAVLDQAIEKFGGLATSSAGAITGIEAVRKSWHNLILEVAQEFHPGFDQLGQQLDRFLEWIRKRRAEIPSEAANLGIAPLAPPAWMTSVSGSASFPLAPAGTNGPTADQQTAISDWWTKRQEIDSKFSQSVSDEGARFSQQRLQSETNYQEQVTQSAADFAKQRMRAQEDYERSIVDIMRAAQQRDQRMAEDHDREIGRMQRDSAQRIGKLDEELNRNIAQQRADSAERLAGFADQRDKDIESKRKDSADNLLKIDQDYNDQRAQAQLAHQDTLSNAAARLDAFAVFEEQRRFAREQAQAAKSHDEKVDDEKEKLQKSIDQVNEAYNQKVSDEKKSLDKSIKQAQEAHDRQVKDEQDALQQRINDANDAYNRQLQDARNADTQRITDMAANFKLQKQREDDDQTDRMNQMATHHNEEMTQFNTEHNQRIGQIIDHASDERKQVDTEFQNQMKALGLSNDAWDKLTADHNTEALRQQKLFYDEQNKAFLESSIIALTAQLLLPGADIGTLSKAIEGFNTLLNNANEDIKKQIGLAPTVGTSSVSPTAIISATAVTLPPSAQVSATGNNTAVTIAAGAIVINGVSGQTATDLAGIIDQRIYNAVLRATGRG